MWITTLTAVVVIYVIFMTTDAMHLCQAYISALTRYEVSWPKPQEGDRLHEMNLDQKTFDRMQSIDMIMYRTEMITPTIILPFTLVLFLLVGRSSIFDGWEWNAPLIAIYIGLTGYLLARALLMQREAEKARDRIVARMQRHKNKLRATEKDGNELSRHLAQTDSVVDYVLGVSRGAFVPWLRHPIVQAMLLPFTGFGAIAILDAFLLS